MHEPKFLANALVRVTSGGSVYDTRADTECVYEFCGLPSGNYEFAPELVRYGFAYIVPAHEKVIPKGRQLYWEGQDKEGFFTFVHIPPGDYLIVVNPDDSRNPSWIESFVHIVAKRTAHPERSLMQVRTQERASAI